MKYFYTLLVVVTASLLMATSCNNKPDLTPSTSRTVIIYMVANNNLSSYAINNINEMEEAFSKEYGAKLLVFYNKRGGVSELLDVTRDATSSIVSPVVKSYEASVDPCLPQTLSRVIADCRAYSPTEQYSIVFWSHATGWLPQGMHPANAPQSGSNDGPDYTFGSTTSFPTQMEINALAAALPSDIMFEYILFDACHMGAIEVAYELRNNTRYTIGSASESLASGFPYVSSLKYMLSNNVVGIASDFFNYYNSQKGVFRSATISVVESSKLSAVATELKSLVNDSPVSLTAKQQFGRYLGTSSDFEDLMWDTQDLLVRSWGQSAANDFLSAYYDAVIYKAATPILFEGDGNGSITVNVFSGLSIYIPKIIQPQALKIYTNNYAWARDTELYKLADL